MNDFLQIQSVSIQLGLFADHMDVSYVDSLPLTHASLYGKNQVPSIVVIDENGYYRLLVSKFLKNSEKKLAIIRGMIYADFYRRNQYMKNTKRFRHSLDIQSYREKYGASEVDRLNEAFEAVAFLCLQGHGNVYDYVVENQHNLLPWQKRLGQEIKVRKRQQSIIHSTSLLREGWASIKQTEILSNVLSKKDAIEATLLFSQMNQRPTGIRLHELGKTLLQQLSEAEIIQAVETLTDEELIHHAYTKSVHERENISIMFTKEKHLDDYEIVKIFLIHLSNLDLYPILEVDRVKTKETGELTVYYQARDIHRNAYFQQLRLYLQQIWGEKVFIKPKK
ncbi:MULTISPECIES: hypothetical protein [Allobacillus]|uniref:Uncharacterized protein n=1 Tax=Allobacillus salarius TaxID=1955272 RepID=A0A556PNN1_9BACI|nr:hypothetical protein [Allobacillus salarius]TSJ66003.1 hypothetical protein FPQ13_05395 [Allobacillus salarius]